MLAGHHSAWWICYYTHSQGLAFHCTRKYLGRPAPLRAETPSRCPIRYAWAVSAMAPPAICRMAKMKQDLTFSRKLREQLSEPRRACFPNPLTWLSAAGRYACSVSLHSVEKIDLYTVWRQYIVMTPLPAALIVMVPAMCPLHSTKRESSRFEHFGCEHLRLSMGRGCPEDITEQLFNQSNPAAIENVILSGFIRRGPRLFDY